MECGRGSKGKDAVRYSAGLVLDHEAKISVVTIELGGEELSSYLR